MKPIPVYMAIIAVLLSACNGGNHSQNKSTTADMQLPINASEQKTEDQNKSDKPVEPAKIPPPGFRIGNTLVDWNKKIMKTAEVTLELKDYTIYNQKIHSELKAFGAYIAAEEQNLNDNRTANNIVIKVPVEQFDNVMNSFSGEGIKVLQKKISSEDVTGEVVDTRSRMEAKKQMRNRYLELLKQAKNMKEILEVQHEINAIQEDIESASGRVTYLTHQSTYSTIHLQYFQYLDGATNHENPKYFVQLKDAFNLGISVIGNLIIFMVTLWPLLLVGILISWVWKKRKVKPAKP